MWFANRTWIVFGIYLILTQFTSYYKYQCYNEIFILFFNPMLVSMFVLSDFCLFFFDIISVFSPSMMKNIVIVSLWENDKMKNGFIFVIFFTEKNLMVIQVQSTSIGFFFPLLFLRYYDFMTFPWWWWWLLLLLTNIKKSIDFCFVFSNSNITIINDK